MHWLFEIRWKRITGVAFMYMVFVSIVRIIELNLAMRYFNPKHVCASNLCLLNQSSQMVRIALVATVFYTFVTGVVLATLYDFLRPLLFGAYWRRVYRFSDIVLSLYIVLWCVPAFVVFGVPLSLLAIWTLSGGITIVFAAMVFARYLHHGK